MLLKIKKISPPQTPPGELTALPRPQLDLRGLLLRGGRQGTVREKGDKEQGERKGEEKGKRGGKGKGERREV